MRFPFKVPEDGTGVSSILVGRLTSDTKHLDAKEDKKAVYFFSIANNDNKEPEYIDVAIYESDKEGKPIYAYKGAQYISKGKLVSLQGIMSYKKDNNSNPKLTMTAYRLELLERKDS